MPYTSTDLARLPLSALMDVDVVTGSKVTEKASDVPASIVVIDREEIETFGYQSVGEILENVPGFYNIDDYALADNFGVRGFWTDSPNKHLAILINGFKHSANYSDDNDFRYFPIPVEAIERIEIIRGPNTLIYGSGAIWGVINIITTPPKGTNPQHRISLTGGSLGTRALRASVQSSSEVRSISGFISLRRRDGYPYDYSDFNGSLSGSLESHITKSNVMAGLTLEQGPLKVQLLGVESNDQTLFLYPAVGDGSQASVPGIQASALYDHPLHRHWRLMLQATFSHLADHQDFHMLYPAFYGRQDLSASGWNWSAELYFDNSRGFKFTLGSSGQRVHETENTYTLPGFKSPALENVTRMLHPDDVIADRALYGRLTWDIFKYIQATAGLRMEQQQPYRIYNRHAEIHDKTEISDEIEYTLQEETISVSNDQWNWVPQLALIFRPHDDIVSKFIYGKALKHPSLYQNLGMDRSAGLHSEWMENYEWVIRYEPGKRLSLSSSLYHSWLSDLILRSAGFYPADHPTSPNQYYNFFDNVGKIKAKGIELQLQYRPHPALRLMAAGVYQQLSNKQKDSPALGYSPDYMLYAKISWTPARKMRAGINAQYIDGMLAGWDSTPADPADPQSPPKGRRGNSVDPALTMNFNFRYDFKLYHDLYVQLKVANFLNSRIRYPATHNSSWAPQGTLAAPRTALFTIGMTI